MLQSKVSLAVDVIERGLNRGYGGELHLAIIEKSPSFERIAADLSVNPKASIYEFLAALPLTTLAMPTVTSELSIAIFSDVKTSLAIRDLTAYFLTHYPYVGKDYDDFLKLLARGSTLQHADLVATDMMYVPDDIIKRSLPVTTLVNTYAQNSWLVVCALLVFTYGRSSND